jgi:hypothetical protein
MNEQVNAGVFSVLHLLLDKCDELRTEEKDKDHQTGHFFQDSFVILKSELIFLLVVHLED